MSHKILHIARLSVSTLDYLRSCRTLIVCSLAYALSRTHIYCAVSVGGHSKPLTRLIFAQARTGTVNIYAPHYLALQPYYVAHLVSFHSAPTFQAEIRRKIDHSSEIQKLYV
jgi:hypothetical protein